MDEQAQVKIHSQSRSKAKHIRKGHTRCDPFKKKQGQYGYALPKKTMRSKKSSKSQYFLGTQRTSYWQSLVSPWLEFDPTVTQRCIDFNSEKFPALKSIDELFSLSSTDCLEHLISFRPVQRYSRLCSLVTSPEAQLILLSKDHARALTISPAKEVCESSIHFGMMISECQSELVEKRSKFMEKLKINESKYDSSLGRMSQVSKELAFTYRTYLQTKKETQTTLHSLSPKLADNFYQNQHLESYKSQYARLLIGKNLRHTFCSLALDRLNYFKMRQYIESDRIHLYENITSFDEFALYVNRRKPKRGRKLTLATACSVCLSDYHEMSNPLVTCEKCHLRAHRLCYSFQQNRCGSCSYQKLQRKVKDVLRWCFICRKPGLMVIKLSQEHYAHGFCLLVHGYWQCGGQGMQKRCSSIVESLCQSSFPLENQCKELVKSIEFNSPIQRQNSISSTSLNQNIKLLQSQNLDLSDCEQSIQDELPSSLVQNIAHIDDDPQKQKFIFPAFDLQKEEGENSNGGCKACGQVFFKDCYLTCQLCAKKYHALCAYLSGFEITLQEGEFSGGSQNLPKLNCCNQSSTVIGQNRRFKLNYNRCVFKMLPGDLQPQSQQSIWCQ